MFSYLLESSKQRPRVGRSCGQLSLPAELCCSFVPTQHKVHPFPHWFVKGLHGKGVYAPL